MKTTIKKWGNSHGIRLPKAILENIHLAEHDTVEILVEDNTIVIRKAKTHSDNSLEKYLEEYYNKDIASILAEAHQPNTPMDGDWRKPVGSEAW